MSRVTTRFLPVSASGKADVIACASIVEEIHRGLRRVVLAAHGWATSASAFMAKVDEQMTGMETYADLGDVLAVPIHWKSSADDDDESPASIFTPFTFYQMKDRADMVGSAAVYGLITEMMKAAKPDVLDITLIGHSFGARVVLACLTTFAGAEVCPDQPTFTALLLQGALDNDGLEKGKRYGGIARLQRTRIRATYSPLDTALGKLYYLATGFHRALGATGPTPATFENFTPRLEALDIGYIQGKYPEYNNGPSGSHSTLGIPEIFQMNAEYIASPFPI
jgi:hypothetical protein